MSVTGSQRRGQRRRLLMSWGRAPESAAARPGPQRHTMADYAPEALPEHHPGLATLLPFGVGRLTASACGIVAMLAAVLAAGFSPMTFAWLARLAGPRYTGSVAALQACVDPQASSSLATWMAQMLLVASAMVALVVRFMRRHRRDDYAGRYRAWGWLATLLLIASCTAQVPLGRAAGAFVSDSTGVAFGPSGYGWWVAIATTLLTGVSLWAVLPLHERAATAAWLSAALAAWGVAAAATWLGGGPRLPAGVDTAAWAAGSGLLAIAMLVAARSVIREVRGEAGGRMKPNAVAATPRPAVPTRDTDEDEPQEDATPPDDTAATRYTDGSDFDEEREPRHLSKAERKRLKKLARMNRVA